MNSKKFTNLQLELLELYSMQVSDEELNDLQQLLSLYYAKKAITAADDVWEKRRLNEKVMQEWLEKKM